MPDPWLTPDGQAVDIGGLHPAVAQSIGLTPIAPPPVDSQLQGLPQGDMSQLDVPPAPEPVTQLPPEGAPLVTPGSIITPASPAHPDYVVPVSEIGAPLVASPQAKAKPVKPQTYEQQKAGIEQRQAGVDQQKEAAINEAVDVEAPKNAADLVAIKQHQAADLETTKRLQENEDNRKKTYAALTMQIDANNKAIDNYKIDPNKYMHDQGVGGTFQWAIAMALSSFGRALSGDKGPDPVLAMLQEKQHAAVVAQVDARDQLKEKGTRLRGQRTDAGNEFANRDAEILRRDSINDRINANALAVAAASIKDPQLRAIADAKIADQRQQSVDKASAAIDKEAEHQHQQATLGIAGGHLALANKQFNAEYGPQGFKQQELDLRAADEARKALADQQKAIREAQKAHKDTAIGDPNTGNALLNEKGRKLAEAAAKEEAATRADPAKAAQADRINMARSQWEAAHPGEDVPDQLKTPAQKLREQAYGPEGVEHIDDKGAAKEITNTMVQGQNIYGALAEARDFLKKDPDITDREGWAKQRAKMETMFAQEGKFLGERVTQGAIKGVREDIIKFDPDSLWDRTVKKGPGIAAIEGLMEATKGAVNSELKGHKIKSEWVPTSPLDNPATAYPGKTTEEAADEAKPNAINRALAHVVGAAPSNGEWDAQNEARADANSRPGSVYGLDPKDVVSATTLIDRAKNMSDSDYRSVVKNISNTVAFAEDEKGNPRTSLGNGLMGLVHDRDPIMYKEILNVLPKARADEISSLYDTAPTFDAKGKRIGGAPPSGIIPQSVIDNFDYAQNKAKQDERRSFVRGKGKLDEALK